jgi:ribosomal protein L28
MAKCYVCEKATTFGKQVSMSHSHVSGRSNKKVKVNLKKLKLLKQALQKQYIFVQAV